MLRTFQIAHEFSTLTVRENLMTVPAEQSGEKLIDAWFRPGKIRAEEARLRERADDVIDFLQLGQVRDAVAARPAPRRPKLNDVNFLIIRLGQVDRLALDPVLNLQLGRLGADVGGLRGRKDAGQCRAEED